MKDRRIDPESDRPLISRRALFGVGGAISLSALVAACGGESSDAPGRVGNAPTPTQLPSRDEPGDVVFLRTAASLEFTIIGLYSDLRDLDVFDSGLSSTLDEFVRRHETNAERINGLVQDNGGQPWTCANPWLVERFTDPILELVTGNQEEDLPPSDGQARDAFNTLHAFENLAGATYQQLVGQLSTPALRQASIELAAGSVRRGAFLAYTATGTPDGYVYPEISGAPPEEEEEGGGDGGGDEEDGTTIEPIYALPTRFGDLESTELTVGAPDQDGARESFMLETPADNTYIYPDAECPPNRA